jgi:MFS family permease
MVSAMERDPTKNKIVTVALASGGYFLGYYVSIMNSMAGPILDGRYQLRGSDRVEALGNLNFYFSIGAMISVLGISKLMDTLGRRRLNMLLDLAAIVFVLMTSFESLMVLQLTRFLLGLLASAYCMVAGITLVETLPQHLASQGNMVVYISITGMLLLTFMQQGIFSYATLVSYWRVFLCYPAVIALVRFVVLFHFMTFESPKFITIQYRDDPSYERRLRENFSEIYAEESVEAKVAEVLMENQNTENAAPSLWEVITDPKFRPAMISGIIIQLGQQLSGVNFFVFFSTEFFNNLSGNGKTVSFFLGLGNLLGGIGSMFIVNNMKRLTVIRFGVLAQGLIFFIILLLASIKIYTPLPFMVLLYMFSFGAGMGSTMGLYVNEILPASGVGLAMATRWLAASFIGKLCPIGVALLGSFNMIALFGGLCLTIYFIVSRFCIDPVSDKGIESRLAGSISKLLQPLTDIRASINELNAK